MVTWLTRSLAFIIGGAVLAFAVTTKTVTFHKATMDLQTVGVILLLVGVFDLLLNFGMSMYLNQPTVTATAETTNALLRTTPDAYPVGYPAAVRAPLHETQVIPRDGRNWH
jgi:hypothetical protein